MSPDDKPKYVYYCISETIYESVNSTIYKGHSNSSHYGIVLKCFEKEAHSAYLREMANFGIDHPHLIQYLDTFYFSDGKPCIVYQWFSSTLEKWLEQQGNTDQEFCLQCLDEILQALVHLNNLGRIHCDIKPHNVFVHFDSAGKPHFVLGDLGATCSLREAQETRYTASTPAYTAPERFYQRFYVNSDLYSLGIMAYELCVGTRPFNGTPENLSRSHLSEQPELDAIPYLYLRDFIGLLLDKNPATRIQTAEIALYMLRGVSGQSLPVLAHNEPDQTPSQQGSRIIPTGFVSKLSFSATFKPNSVLIFQSQGEPVAGLDYDNYIEIRNLTTSKQRMLIKTGPARAIDDNALVFVNSTKLMKFNIVDESEECLARLTEATSYFFTDYGYLLLSNKYRSTYCELNKAQDVKFSQLNYLSDLHAGIFPDGDFCISGGPCNQHVYWRNKTAQILGQWELHGPIVSLTCGDNTAMVLTLDMENASRYVIWVIKLDAAPQKRALTCEVMLYTYTKGYFFWLTPDKRLYMCGIDLIVIDLGKLRGTQPVKSFHLTCDHRWLVALLGGSGKQNIIECYQANGDYLYV